jgi:hypothetical protein
MTIHLLKPRGGAACGADVDDSEMSPDINHVTCEACIAAHDAYLEETEKERDY